MKKLVAALVAVALCGSVAVPAFAATKNIKVGDSYFIKKGKPQTITVAKGTTLHWAWKTKLPHNVVSSGAAKFSSGAPKVKGNFSKKLTKAGVYKIVCVVHTALGMKMTVKVK